MARFTQPPEMSLVAVGLVGAVLFALVSSVLAGDWGDVLFLVATVGQIVAVACTLNRF